MSSIRVEGIQSILRVNDMAVSRAFYIGLLGFTEDDWGTNDFTSIHKDAASIYLCRGGQGCPGTWLWVGFDGDMDALHNYLLANGVVIHLAPTNFSWALEMQVQDPDGHILRFGKEPDYDKPFADVQQA